MKDTSSPRRPTFPDVLDHVAGHVAVLRERFFTERVRYNSMTWPEAASRLAGVFGGDASSILREPALLDVERRTRKLLADIRGEGPFPNRWAADAVISASCYLACRLAKPEVVVETGVAYGVSAAFILAALRENGVGSLHSVDLMPFRRRAADFQGIAVRNDDRSGWTLHHGSSRRVLPDLLRDLGGVDVFLHDSLHTRSNMVFEFDLALRHLRPGGVILADDIERNDAFSKSLQDAGGCRWIVADRELDPLHGRAAPTVFGIAVPEPPTDGRYNPPA